jgi:hypothetical protein
VTRAELRGLLPAERAVRFAEGEAALAQIAVDSQGIVQLDLATESALSKAYSDVPDDLTGRGAQRVWFIIRKTFPGPKGEQLVALLERYARYRSALPLESVADGDSTAALERFESVKRLQAQYFGAEAQQLFGEQNALTQYMLGLRRLEVEADLDRQARESRLRILQDELERGMGRRD